MRNSKRTSSFSLFPNSISAVYIYGTILRFLMLTIGLYMDNYCSTTYTDIDYNVFTDASKFGSEFINETYLYHITRKDHRHNFSIWFLTIYQNFNSNSSRLFGLLSFLPQVTSITAIGIAFGKDLCFAAFCQTFAFVAFNKVCTAQAIYLYYANLFENMVQVIKNQSINQTISNNFQRNKIQ
ncbi:GPI mannosyltransferase 1 [Smittium culicis]|uniref:GPI mannosyltransferase 1 n=1 Tax=Smittium culicis TaxID=133412 RepID=A0A1R1YJW6_9FUNG|nr:GPI mannosyltransferase 1 [Smittium culicis]